MVGRDIDPNCPRNVKSGRFPAKRLLITVFMGLVFLISLLILVILLSDNAEAAYGLDVSVQAPKDKILDPFTTPQSINFTIEIENIGTFVESINLTVTFDDPAKPISGWTANPNNFTVNTIDPGVTEFREVTVSAPVGELYPSFTQLTVTGWVQEDPVQISMDSLIARVSPIYDSILISSQDVFNADPGEIIEVTFKMKNTGNGPDTLTLEDITSPPYDFWGQVSLLNNSVTLNPDEEVNITYTIFVDPDVTMAESPIVLWVGVNSTGYGDILTTKSITVNINTVYGVSVSTTQGEKTGDPGGSVVFSIRIRNDGNSQDSFSFGHSGMELGTWEYSWVTLEPDEFVNINYTVDIDSDHDPSDILIILNASSDSDGSGLTYVTLPITVHVNPRYEVKLGVNGSNIKEVGGEETVIFNMTIQNRGTATDTFDIEPVGPNSHWATAEFLTITLDPDEIVVVKIFVTPPKGSDIGLSNITINVTSQNDESATDEYTFYVDVQPTYDLFLSSTDPSASGYPGDTVYLTFRIKNIGNSDDTYTIDVIVPPGWTWGYGGPPYIPPDDTQEITIWIKIPNNAASQLYEIYITGTSDGDPDVYKTTLGWIEVYQAYGIQLPSSISGKTVDVGDIVAYIIEVKNTGTGDDTIELRITGDLEPWAWLYYSPPENGTIIHVSPPAGGSLAVTLYIFPPSDYWDTYDGTIDLVIEAESLDDPDVNPAFDSVSVTTTVNPAYGVDILNGGFTSGDPGELVSFLFDVKNNGTTTDSFNLRVDSIAGPPGADTSLWIPEIYFNPTSISNLGTGGLTSVTMYVDIPFPLDLSHIPSGLYDITIEVSSANDPAVLDTEVFTVNVQQYYWADIQNSVPTKNVDVGSSVQYQITIKNLGNDADLFSCDLEGDLDIPGSVNWGKLTHVGTGQVNVQSLVDIPLNSGQSTDIILTITIPLRTDPGYPSIDPDTVTLKVIVKPSDLDGISDEVDVTADINTIYEFDFIFLAATLDVIPGYTADFTIKIENKGTSSETFTYEISQWEVDWSAYGHSFSPSSITIAANDIGDVTFYLNTPTDLDEATSGYYDITIKVHSTQGNSDVFNNCTVFLEPVYDLTVAPQGATAKAVNAGSDVTYSFTLRNTGNTPETFVFDVMDLDTSSSGGGDQSSWTRISLESAPATPINSIYLNEGETKNLILVITVPSQNDPDFAVLTSSLQIEVEARSEQDPIIRDSFISSTTVNPIFRFEFSSTAPMNKKEGEPTHIVQFTLLIRNTGTATDSYEFRVTSVDESIFTAPDPNDINNLGVDNYGTTLFSVTIDADNFDALVGLYEIEVTAHSQADPSVTVVLSLWVEITAWGDLDLNPTSQTKSGEPGESIDYVIRVTNEGNAQDTFDLSLEGIYKDWAEILDNQNNPIKDVTLNAVSLPGSFTDIKVRVAIPGTGETSAGQIYAITVKASSTNTDGVSKTVQVATAVEDYVELILEYSGSGNASRDYDPNKKAVKFSFRVTNNGNQDEESIEIRVDDIDSEWDYSPTILADSLEPGGASTFSVEFSIPSDESVGTYDMEVYVVSSVDPSVQSDSVFITVEIIKPDLAVFASDIMGLDDIDNLRGKVGNAVTISAEIQNIGDTEAKNVQVKLYEDSTLKGTKSISSIAAGSSRRVDFRWTVPAEEVEITVEITPQEEIDEGNNEHPPIFLDLRPDLSFSGEAISFSNSNPDPGEKITINANIRNTGGDAEDVVVKFFDGTKLIGMDTIDIDFEEVGVAQLEWEVPNKPGKSVEIKAEIEYDHHGPEEARTISIAEGGILSGGGTIDTSFILLFIALAIIGCVASVFFGYQLGKIKKRDDSGNDYEDYEEYEEYDEPATTPLASSDMPYPPPPPPPPPPEDYLGPLDNEMEGTEGKDGGQNGDRNDYQVKREIVDQEEPDTTKEEAQINGEKIPEFEKSNE